MKKVYLKSDKRREIILQVACAMAENDHYDSITRDSLIQPCGTCGGNISRIMGNIENLKSSLVKYAIENHRVVVVAQAIMNKHPAVAHLNNEQRQYYLNEALAA